MINLSPLRYQTPLTHLEHRLFKQNDITVLVKHDYLNHPTIQGNKLWKLIQPLSAYNPEIHDKIISFGGAFSNHLYALSEVAEIFKIPFTAIVRGEKPPKPGHTLSKLIENTFTELVYLNRPAFKAYRESMDTSLLPISVNKALIIPEGGSLKGGLSGFKWLWQDVGAQTDLNKLTHVIVPVGTGGTAAGALMHLPDHIKILAVPVLKHNNIRTDIKQLADIAFDENRLLLLEGYHFGGYARVNDRLIDFIANFYKDYTIPIDPIYNGKMFYALFDMVKQEALPKDAVILVLHTGGLQGLTGFQKQTGLLQSITW